MLTNSSNFYVKKNVFLQHETIVMLKKAINFNITFSCKYNILYLLLQIKMILMLCQ